MGPRARREAEDRAPPDIVMAALFAMLLLLGGLVGLTLYQQGRISSQQTSINKAQHDIKSNQHRLDRQQAMLAYLERATGSTPTRRRTASARASTSTAPRARPVLGTSCRRSAATCPRARVASPGTTSRAWRTAAGCRYWTASPT
jgi:hypothetical protein